MSFRFLLTRPLFRYLLPLALVLAPGSAWAQVPENLVCERISELTRTYLHKHISFHYVNDELRQRVTDNYVKRLDPSKTLYLSSEVRPLKEKVSRSLQQIWEGNCSSLQEIQADQIIKAKETLNRILAQHTGQSYETVSADGERDKYFTAEEAKAYGLVDEVFEHAPDTKKDAS